MMRKIAHLLAQRLPYSEVLRLPQSVRIVHVALLLSSSTILSILVFSLGLYLHRYIPELNILLLSLIPVLASAWFGTFYSGIFSTVILVIAYIYFFIPPSVIGSPSEAMSTTSVFLFVIVGSLICYLIHIAKRVDEVELQEQEKLEYAQLLSLAEQQYREAQSEIVARDEFLSVASHELKSPLTLSLLQIQRALHNIRNVSLANFSVQKLMDMLESVEQQTDRLSKMIADLSDVSLITTGRMRLETEEMDLSEVVNSVIERVPISMRKADYPITFEVDGEVRGVWDRVRLEQVVTNVVSNAIKYGESKPIEIELKKKKKRVELTISDSGAGIPHELQERVFERFERGAAKKGIKGLGVGLWITHQIVTAHDGKIKLKSKQGKGTQLRIYLPC